MVALSTFHVDSFNMLINGKNQEKIIEKANMENGGYYFPCSKA